MRVIRALVVAAALSWSAAAGAQEAQPARENASTPEVADVAATPAPAQTETSAPVPTSAPQSQQETEATIELETVDLLDSRTSHRGDTFALRVVTATEINGQAIPEGALAQGEVVDVLPSNSAGQPGMLVLSVSHLELDGRQLPLKSPTLMLSGQDRLQLTHAASFVSPLLFLIEGQDISVPAGSRLNATLASADEAQTPGRIVFFRPRRNYAAVYRYGVREGDTELRLRNGSYATMDVAPGVHEFTMVGPYFGGAPSRTLRLRVHPGETLYVEHTVNFLQVSNREAFESQTLRLNE